MDLSATSSCVGVQDFSHFAQLAIPSLCACGEILLFYAFAWSGSALFVSIYLKLQHLGGVKSQLHGRAHCHI